MSARDDYPAIAVLTDAWAVKAGKQPEAVRALFEIELLREQLARLQQSYDALVSNSSAEHQRMSDLCQALSTNVTRLDEEKEQDAATIAVLDSALRHLNAWCPSVAPRQEEINRLLTRAPLPMRSLLQLRARFLPNEYDGECTDCPVCPMIATDRDDALAELNQVNPLWMKAQAERDEYYHDAQLLYMEQQRWQEMAEDLWEELQEWHVPDCLDVDGNRENCTCHRILAAKWDELTAAAEYADEDGAS